MHTHRIDAEQWFNFDTKYEVDGIEDIFLDLRVVSPDGPATIYGVDYDGELVALATGADFTFRRRIIGFKSLLMMAPGQASCRVNVRDRQQAEPHDDARPPVAKLSDNPLVRLRQKAMAEYGVMRESFLEEQGIVGYEIEDDEPPMFEEEMALQAQVEAEASKNAPEGPSQANQPESGTPLPDTSETTPTTPETTPTNP